MSKTVFNDTMSLPNPIHEVFINKVGDNVVITPKDELQISFFTGLMTLTDDFMKDGGPE